MRVLLLVTLLPTLVCASLTARTYDDFDIRPAPGWVERVEAETSLEVARSQVRWGIYSLLSDHQVRVDDRGTTEFFRRVRRVLSPSGVQNASELSIDFDPSFQRLVFHEVRVLRDGVAAEQLDPDEVRVIEKEDDAGSGIYDGERTALLFLRDVRPGDVIDYSFSLEGANPILGGRYADEYELVSGVPARRIRHRLLWPAARPLHFRSSLSGFEPTISRAGDEQIYLWQRNDVAAIEVEDSTPDWYDPWPSVQLSEFGSWSEVARWAVSLFQPDAASTQKVRELAAQLRAKHPTQREQATAAIRFVQDDIRYLGIELGRNSHEPHQPAATLDQRWGDCKDKAFLLAMLLRELGIEAYPALVNTVDRRGLDQRLPSPFLFDHVIAQVVSGGKSYWIDGTIADQGGSLETAETPDYERALVIRPESSALTRMKTNTAGAIVVEQTYTSRDYTSPADLTVRSTFTGSEADAMRAHLATVSVSDLARDRVNLHATDQPKIEPRGEPQLSDDRVRNTIVMTERYVVHDLWRNGDWTFYPRSVEPYLSRPDTMIRSTPLAFDYPLDVTQRLIFHLPAHFDLDTGTEVTESPTFRYAYAVDTNGNTVTVTHTLRALRDHVPVSEVADHLTKLNDIRDRIGYRLAVPHRGTAAHDVQTVFANASAVTKWTTGGAAVVVLVVLCCWMVIPRGRAQAERRQPVPPITRSLGFRPGEAPASALTVRDAADLRARLVHLACWCGARISGPGELQTARYDEREMTIVTRRCERCGQEQSLYFHERRHA